MEFLVVSGGVSQSVNNTVQGHDSMVIPENQELVLKFMLDNCETQRPLDECEEIVKNFCAVLNKSWKFIFPNENPPRNPHHYGSDYRSVVSHPRVRFSPSEDRRIEIFFPDATHISKPQLKSIIWRMANAFEWCALPNRKKLSGQSSFTRETWNAISVYRSAEVLARTTLSGAPAPDLEPVALDHQAQTDAAE